MSDTALLALEQLPLWVQLPAALLLVVAGVFTLAGSVGLLRFEDFYMKLHAPTKASTLGVGGALLAGMLLAWASGSVGWHLVLIALFLFMTAPVSANLMAMAALHLRVHSRAAVPDDLPQP